MKKRGSGSDCVDQQKRNACVEAVHHRSQYQCVLTGKTKDLECHHIFGWHVSPERSYLK